MSSWLDSALKKIIIKLFSDWVIKARIWRILPVGLTLIFFVCTAGLFSGCQTVKPRATGVENQILVFVSKEDMPFVVPFVNKIFGRIIYTPEPEKIFEIIYGDPENFPEKKLNHHLLFVSLLSPSDNSGDSLVKVLMPRDHLELVSQGNYKLLSGRDVFARGQRIGILTADNKEVLREVVKNHGKWLLQQYENTFLELQEKHLFKRREQKKLSAKFARDYGWTMRIQHDYMVIKEEPKRNFVWLGRMYPYRWISVLWEENARDSVLEENSVKEKILNFPHNFYGEIRFLEMYLKIESATLNQYRAWRSEGLWEHTEQVMGGPFVSYLFYDNNSKRLYHINFLLHGPGHPKVILLSQMEIMARTFRSG